MIRLKSRQNDQTKMTTEKLKTVTDLNQNLIYYKPKFDFANQKFTYEKRQLYSKKYNNFISE